MEVDEQSGVPDGWKIVASGPPAPSEGTWEDRGIGGKVWHPASGAKEGNRVDNSVLGMPPEAAAMGIVGVGRAVAGAAPTVAARTVAAAKGVMTEAAPMMKYEIAKQSLRAIHVPEPLAIPIAMVISGYRGNGKHAPTADAPPVETTSPVEAAPAAATPPAPMTAAPPAPAPPASAAPQSPMPQAPAPDVQTRLSPAAASAAVRPATPQNYPQKFLNETALQARRQGVKLSDADYAQAYALIQKGATPAEAVSALKTPADIPETAAAKPRLSAPEMVAFSNLLRQGKTPSDALKTIEAMRKLAGGLPTSADVAANVAARNATGRWPQ